MHDVLLLAFQDFVTVNELMIEEPKRSISELFVSAMSQLETGGMTLDEFNQLVGLTGKAVPGDDKQQRFYTAIKELAAQVDAMVNKPSTN